MQDCGISGDTTVLHYAIGMFTKFSIRCFLVGLSDDKSVAANDLPFASWETSL